MLRHLFTLFVGAIAVSTQAQATAFAGVEESFWQADFAYYDDLVAQTRLFSLPSGVVLRCTGTAFSDGTGGCMDRRSASVTSDTGALVASTINALGGFALFNETGGDYAGTFVFDTTFSSFDPGGIGASVDNPAREYASFFTVVSGPGVFDLHGCDMHHGASAGGALAPQTCGVTSPDVSFGEALLGPLAAGGTINAEYQIYIRVVAQGDDPKEVPEAPVAFLLSAGLLLLAWGRHGSRRP